MTTFSKENKAVILAAPHLKTDRVDVPEWGDGVTVIVAEMTGAARDAFYAARDGADKNAISESQAQLLKATVVDDAGQPVLDDGDINALRAQGSAVLDRIADAAMKINGMTATAVDDAAKNSAAAPSGDSGSASPAISAAQ
ncbi:MULTISPECIES: hypothetical protein [Burkholderia cepacia complex]|jgi:hypothetical protein|uniref:Phage tail protein n=1 Tax=Burkholderia vietnamiensis TaxID=60552 RepID=A0ABS1ATN6_BURVI|nr:hypothetical protein [Burkholderia vietnamiensis]MBJ9687518.1 hypothetical protein [Burkholderia vietnamiensis]